MKKNVLLSLAGGALLTLSLCGFQTDNNDLSWPAFTNEAQPWTRWWWLGSAVDKPSLSANLEDLHKAGIGGVEITPIYGVKGNDANDIKFLSPQWMEMLKHTISEGSRLGMGVDMNTGTGWPFGGPQITANEAAGKVYFQKYKLEGGEKLSEKIVINEKKQKDVASLGCLMAYSFKGEKLNITAKVSADGTLDWTAPAGSWKLIAMFNGKTLQAVKRAAPGGEGLVLDHFSASAVQVYLNRFTKAFDESGSPRPHAFFNDSYEVYNADWTTSFLDEFSKRRGYKLEDYFPEFMGEGNADITARVKSDYRQTMSEILLDNFTRTWTDWAHSMGSTNRNQAHGSPANILDLYSTVDIPECETFGTTPFDIPGLRRDTADIRKGDADPMMLKFASSAAHVSGKKIASSETFTWVGEHFKVALSQCKPEVDQLFLAGINHVYFHGSTYSPKEAKWPGWLFYASTDFVPNNTFWRDMPGLTGYITRCQSFLQSGFSDNDFIVYWPIFDAWNNAKGMDIPFKIHSIEEWLKPTMFYKTINYLRDNGYDFDYVSDRLLMNGNAEDGKISLGGNHYKTLIVPACKFIPVETLQKIAELAAKGAKVVFIGSLPEDVPGFGNLESRREQLSKVKESLKADKQVLVENISAQLFEKIGVKKEAIAETGVKFIRQRHAEGFQYFFANLQSKSISQWVTLSVNAKSAAIFDPVTGKSGVAQTSTDFKSTRVFLQLEPGQSLIVKTWTNKVIEGENWAYYKVAGPAYPLDGKWNLTMTEGYPAISQTFVVSPLVSWTTLNNPDLKSFSGTGKYTLTFKAPRLAADNWQLSLGRVGESARVKINGNDLGIFWSIPFAANVGQYLKKGDNVIEVEVTNLPANRIADMDRKKIEWRIFKEINFANVNYLPFDASGWKPMESGLMGPVTLIPLKKILP